MGIWGGTDGLEGGIKDFWDLRVKRGGRTAVVPTGTHGE
jgi:hypothetical protein